jgi:DNA-binding LacI/PurR family transcriptional regulator
MRYTSPPLTTVRARLDELARCAFAMLDAGAASTAPESAKRQRRSLGGAIERVIVPTDW